MARVHAIEFSGDNMNISLESRLARELKVDQSVSHNGVCLTVTRAAGELYEVTAIAETLRKSNLGKIHLGEFINIERSLLFNGRVDGHIVQGHVDQTGICTYIQQENGSWLFSFSYDPGNGNLTVEKGSITVNGVSLTVVDSGKNNFSVAIIPYTFEHTNFQFIKTGDTVNLEFDILGKYIRKYLQESGKI